MTPLKMSVVKGILLLIIFSIPVSMVSADHSPTHSRWSIEIGEDGDVIESMMLSEQGTALIPLHIVNENLVSITIAFNYTVPFDATISGPESITVEGNSEVKLQVSLRGVDILNFVGGSEEEFEVTGTVTSRQGLPISVPGDSDSAQVEIAIPTVKKMALGVEGPIESIDAGEEASVLVTITNEGNVRLTPFNVQLTSNCAIMTIDRNLGDLDRRYEPNEAKSQEALLEIPNDNPTEICRFNVEVILYPNDDLSYKVTINESVNVKINGLIVAEQEINVSEITESLPAQTAIMSVFALFSAALSSIRRPYHNK
jgi:hypothetical protein